MQELAEVQQLHDQEHEALVALHAEERKSDRGLKREFAEADAAIMPKLVALYKARLAPAAAAAAPGSLAGAAAAGAGFVASSSSGLPSTMAAQTAAAGSTGTTAPGSLELEFAPMSYSTASVAALISSAAGGGAAVAAVWSGSGSGDGGGAADLRAPLGPAAVQVSALSDAQRPEGLDVGLWERFVEYTAARGELDIAVREETAKVRCPPAPAAAALDRLCMWCSCC